MTPGFSEETKQAIYESQNGYCKVKGCHNSIHSVHHKLHDTEYNRRKYPLFIDSPFNAVGLCEHHHTQKSHEWRVTDQEAKMYEEYLDDLIMYGR
ncbi:MAG: hypothetical protein ACTSPD_10175 [Promethearchaeota archaeon]